MDTAQPIEQTPGEQHEEDLRIAEEAALTGVKKTKVELSPKYQEILSGYLRLRDDPKFKPRQYYRFVAKLDSEITLRNFETWVAKVKRNEERERQIRIKNFAETTLNNATTIEAIRDGAIKVFYLKVTEFLKNPDMLERMTMKQALELYTSIEKLHLATKQVNLKERDQNRKDVFTLFSIAALSGSVDEEAIQKIQQGAYEGQPQQPVIEGT